MVEQNRKRTLILCLCLQHRKQGDCCNLANQTQIEGDYFSFNVTLWLRSLPKIMAGARKPTEDGWYAQQATQTLSCSSLSGAAIGYFKSRNQNFNLFQKSKPDLLLRKNSPISIQIKRCAAFLASARHWIRQTSLHCSQAQAGSVEQRASPPPGTVISMRRRLRRDSHLLVLSCVLFQH